MIQLKGSRLYLREFQPDDWASVHAYASMEIVCRFQPWGPNNEEQTQVFVPQSLLTLFILIIGVKGSQPKLPTYCWSMSGD